MLGMKGDDTFRNANGVYMKLMELRKYDPNYSGKGLGRHLRPVELEAWNLTSDELDAAVRSLERLLADYRAGTKETRELAGIDEAEITFAPEGRLITRLHISRERDAGAPRKLKQSRMKKLGRLQCEACGFDFFETYGERGLGFIECHHTTPVSEMVPGHRPKQSEFALLCANCHRMIHARRPWLTVAALKATLSCRDEIKVGDQKGD